MSMNGTQDLKLMLKVRLVLSSGPKFITGSKKLRTRSQIDETCITVSNVADNHMLEIVPLEDHRFEH